MLLTKYESKSGSINFHSHFAHQEELLLLADAQLVQGGEQKLRKLLLSLFSLLPGKGFLAIAMIAN